MGVVQNVLRDAAEEQAPECADTPCADEDQIRAGISLAALMMHSRASPSTTLHSTAVIFPLKSAATCRSARSACALRSRRPGQYSTAVPASSPAPRTVSCGSLGQAPVSRSTRVRRCGRGRQQSAPLARSPSPSPSLADGLDVGIPGERAVRPASSRRLEAVCQRLDVRANPRAASPGAATCGSRTPIPSGRGGRRRSYVDAASSLIGRVIPVPPVTGE